MDIKIEKNIPIPAKNQKGLKYPFDEMGKGDSFFVPMSGTKYSNISSLRNVIQSAMRQYVYKNIDKAFSTRSTDDGIRVWRTK